MNHITDFYDHMDLKYPEIGIAMQDIDTSNPGRVKMIVPILTPNLDNSKLYSVTRHLSKDNLMNAKKETVDVKNIKITNYVEIPFPSEICGNSEIIPAGSKWIIVFIGGDITKPRPIARYIE